MSIELFDSLTAELILLSLQLKQQITIYAFHSIIECSKSNIVKTY